MSEEGVLVSCRTQKDARELSRTLYGVTTKIIDNGPLTEIGKRWAVLDTVRKAEEVLDSTVTTTTEIFKELNEDLKEIDNEYGSVKEEVLEVVEDIKEEPTEIKEEVVEVVEDIKEEVAEVVEKSSLLKRLKKWFI